VSVALSKRLLWEGLSPTVEQMRERENPIFAWIGSQPDAREGVLSFLEKRPPRWSLSPTKDLPDLPKR
jgi:enoyl-CoA hydratase/carnithine racemase